MQHALGLRRLEYPSSTCLWLVVVAVVVVSTLAVVAVVAHSYLGKIIM